MMNTANRRRSAFAFASATFLAAGIFGACHNSTSVTSVPDDPSIVFGPAPALFEPGAQMAVIQGDPSVAGAPFTIRLKMPDGYKIAPHTHPTDENVTVIDGTFKVGMGNTFDENAMASVQRAGFVSAPALHAHYAKAVGATTVQVTAIGPFAMTYINPNDLPKAAQK
ncbi:MAG: cupin domain-containing protein [Gemmatimonadaceae bacterium]